MTALVETMLTAGAEPVAVLTDVIAAAQRAVGARWQRGEWTIAQEHAATAMAVAATKTVTQQVRRRPATRGRIVVACAEREWHALPAMIIDCALRAHGWDTTLLGASTSPRRLNQYLQDLGPAAIAVSCSMLGALPATRRFIEASTTAGVPVVVGGAAFGSTICVPVPSARRPGPRCARCGDRDGSSAGDRAAGADRCRPGRPGNRRSWKWTIGG